MVCSKKSLWRFALQLCCILLVWHVLRGIGGIMAFVSTSALQLSRALFSCTHAEGHMWLKEVAQLTSVVSAEADGMRLLMKLGEVRDIGLLQLALRGCVWLYFRCRCRRRPTVLHPYRGRQRLHFISLSMVEIVRSIAYAPAVPCCQCVVYRLRLTCASFAVRNSSDLLFLYCVSTSVGG